MLRSETPDPVRQEFYGLLMAHFANVRLMHETALNAKQDPDQLSFLPPYASSAANWPSIPLFPHGRRGYFMTRFWKKSLKNVSPPAATGAIPAG